MGGNFRGDLELAVRNGSCGGMVQDRASLRHTALQNGLDIAVNCHRGVCFEMEIWFILTIKRQR